MLGEPNGRLSSKEELRFGSNGSLALKIGGDQRGTWFDHESGEGGGVLDLVRRERGGDKASAVAWLSEHFPDEVKPVERERPSAAASRIVATYPYRDEKGDTLFEVVRREPKDFRQRRPNGKGGYDWSVKGVRAVPYRLPELLHAIGEGATIFIVEGEKDVERLADQYLAATCNAGGAGKWSAELVPFFAGARVVILPDNDDAGREHGEAVARALRSVAESVKVVALPNLPRKGDVSDWLDAGGTAKALYELADRAAEWRPTAAFRFPVVFDGAEDDGAVLTWLVRNVLPGAGLSIIYGPPKSSKTFLALDLAFHVAHGLDWFGHRVERGGAVYVSGEGSLGVRQRMKAWRQEHKVDATPRFAMIPRAVNLFDGDEELTLLIDTIRELRAHMGEPVRLVVLDTLSRMIGSGDEDKARDMNAIVRAAGAIQEQTGAHVLGLHHSGKDRERGMRGSNALLGAVDTAIEVQRFDTGLCEAKVVAIKDGGEVAPFKYTLRQSTVGHDDEGEPIASCIVEPAGASQGDEQRPRRLTDGDKQALAELDRLARDMGTGGDMGGFVPLSTWRDRCYSAGTGGNEARKKAFQRAKERLEAAGMIELSGEQVRRAERP